MSYPLILVNGITSAVICEVMVSQDMTVIDVCQQASVFCSSAATAMDVVLVKDGKVLEGEIYLGDLGLDKGGSVHCVKMTPTDAKAARQHAKLARLLATSLEQFRPVMPKNLAQEPFGEELATLAALSLKAGNRANGRLKHNCRMGVMSTSSEDAWTLSVDTRMVPLCNSREEIDGLTIVWRIAGQEVTSWETVESFVQFWALMNEEKIAALMAGLMTALDKPNFVTGTVTYAQLKQLAKLAPDAPTATPVRRAPARAPADVLAAAFAPVTAEPKQIDLNVARKLQAHEEAPSSKRMRVVAREATRSLLDTSVSPAAVDDSKPIFQIRVCFDDGSHKVVRLNDNHTVGDLRCLCSRSEALELKARFPGALPMMDDSISLRAAGLLNAVVVARPQRT